MRNNIRKLTVIIMLLAMMSVECYCFSVTRSHTNINTNTWNDTYAIKMNENQSAHISASLAITIDANTETRTCYDKVVLRYGNGISGMVACTLYPMVDASKLAGNYTNSPVTYNFYNSKSFTPSNAGYYYINGVSVGTHISHAYSVTVTQ